MVYRQPSSIEGLAHTIIGAGTLGRRIALMWLTQGGTVHLFDSNAEALQSAQTFIDEKIDAVLLEVVPNGKRGTLKVFTDRSEALQATWLVTEAVPENRQLKIDVLGELDAATPESVIIATNSSSFTASEIIDKVTNRARIINMHYYLPPRLLPLEIMPNPYTDAGILPLLVEQSQRHGLLTYAVKKESVGLIANRVWAAIKRECLYVVAEGVAEPAQIDSLLQKGLGFAHPPFYAMDLVGLDVVRDIEAHYRHNRKGLPDEVMHLLDDKIAKNELGAKTGQGFYPHPPKKEVDADADADADDHLIYLDIVKGEVRSMTTAGTGVKILVGGLRTCSDGVQVDSATGDVYFTNMGSSPTASDGTISKLAKGETEAKVVVPSGAIFTPKQCHLDQGARKIYWADREGGRVQRAHLDGSQVETLYDAAPGKPRPLTDALDWCVGVTVDPKQKLVYWTQKGLSKGSVGRILRANLEVPAGLTAQTRTDIETLFDHMPEPIDLEIDSEEQLLFWTDRGDPPFGNTLNKYDVSTALEPKRKPQQPDGRLIVAERFHEAIGLALDTEKRLVYVSDLLGSLWKTDYEGKTKTALVRDEGNFSGLAFVRGQSSQ
ncbi:3-hydroxyacyl-CoA dehydrogenase [Acaromyces ingoldii]|uniref:3-hydroxyacyl-CoA dehydrogenase n=1 Tax=Acaromyces ingoldii TaxID=215250 RepID=A0A316YQU4_9BASI|nr:3-hydroxyacyl-CoA dehydrogenase [Acaromyces ingoldii]PWN91038.1 3-hydroxyacyl-CoA dehydrogenase [Acaromyces ingoldii]